MLSLSSICLSLLLSSCSEFKFWWLSFSTAEFLFGSFFSNNFYIFISSVYLDIIFTLSFSSVDMISFSSFNIFKIGMSSKPNIWASSGTVSIDYFFFLCMGILSCFFSCLTSCTEVQGKTSESWGPSQNFSWAYPQTWACRWPSKFPEICWSLSKLPVDISFTSFSFYVILVRLLLAYYSYHLRQAWS